MDNEIAITATDAQANVHAIKKVKLTACWRLAEPTCVLVMAAKAKLATSYTASTSGNTFSFYK